MHKPDVNASQRWRLMVAGGVMALLAACGGGGGGQDSRAPASADPTVAVAPAASSDAAVATSYTGELAATSASTTDSLDPLPVPAQLAVDDTAEPAPVAH